MKVPKELKQFRLTMLIITVLVLVFMCFIMWNNILQNVYDDICIVLSICTIIGLLTDLYIQWYES